MTLEELKSRISELKEEPIPLASEERLIFASKLRYDALHHNFDTGYDELYRILTNPNCDLSTALQLYWQNRPLFFLNNPRAKDSIHIETFKFKKYLEEKLREKAFEPILQIDPLEFAINTMDSKDEFDSKSEYLDQIPIECLLPINHNEPTRIFYNKIPKNTSLIGVKSLFLFEFQDFKNLEKLEGVENIEEVTISTNPYNRTKPKKRKFKELLIFRNVKKLHLSFYSKFSNLEDIPILDKLTDLKINIEPEDTKHLVGLSNLRSLCYTNLKETSISAITELANLEKLTLLSCPKLNDLSGIEKLSNLTELKIRLAKKLRDIESINELNLKTLIFSEVEISSKKMKAIKDMQIQTLQLDCKKITNLNFIGSDGKLSSKLRDIFLYRLDSSPILKEKLNEYDLSKYKVVEVDMNNSL